MKYSILIIYTLLLSTQIFAQSQTAHVQVNQVGYYINGPKKAVYTLGHRQDSFYIVEEQTKKLVYRGKLSEQKKSQYSSTVTQQADFSPVKKAGNYRVMIGDTILSYVFRIAASVNHELSKAAIKSYYYQRVSEELLPEFAGQWARPAGHPDNQVLIHPSAASPGRPAGTVITSAGGWYDAGDYNKYIVNSGITMGTMLSALEDFPSYFDTLKLLIPESRDAIPDLLNEIAYNLRWMLTMQDPGDGGVYNKCTNAAFDGLVMPGITKAPRYVVQKGTAATLDFAAVTAQASRLLRQYDRYLPRLADSCMKASLAAWAWAEKNPSLAYNQDQINEQFEPKITTGGYGDSNFKDEWFWAAAELYATTRSDIYIPVIQKFITDSMGIPSWNSVHMLGVYTLLRKMKTFPANSRSVIQPIRDKLISYADRMISRTASSAFGTVMGQSVRDFIWGSNSVAGNQSILLINAFKLSGNKIYLQHALYNLDYLLGRNATGYCFVTGFGTKSPMNPHHRPSGADGIVAPIPGFLAGGPNPGKQDKCFYEFTETETAYTDLYCSYASNEIAINWNAPLVYVVSAMEALRKSAGLE